MLLRTCTVALLTLSLASSGDWIRLASPHFDIYTDSGDDSARRVLARFEQARRVLASPEWTRGAAFDTRILLFSSQREYAGIRPASNVPGFYQSGPDRDYIVLSKNAELDRIIFHEYTHLVLNHSSAPLPQWLEEGLAEFYSTLAIGATQVTAGAPIASHLYTLNTERWLTASELASVNRAAPQYNEAGKTGIFYAESWALTHMLTVAVPYREHVPDFLAALSDGQSQQNAFNSAFGKTLDAALSDLTHYIQLGFRTIEVSALPATGILLSKSAPLDAAVAEQSRGEILLLMGRDREAAAIYDAIARRYPASPAAQTGLAVIAMRDHDYESARKCFERAIELGARDGSTYFEYAMLLRDTGASPERVTQFLEKAVAVNPSHAEAHFLLGIRASDAERYGDAVVHLSRATEILPRQAYFWQALSYAYYKLGRASESKAAATRALLCATTDHEAQMARAALQLFDQPPPPPAPRSAGVITPESWTQPQGDGVVTGDLVEVECSAGSARLHIRTPAGTVTLEVKDPRTVVIRGGPIRRTFACGAQQPAPVLVEFDPATRRVTALEFRPRNF